MIEFSIQTLAFFRDPPIPVTITIGWDRPTNMLYLYIELRDDNDKAFASPEGMEYLFHCDLTNGFSTTSSLDNYLNVFRRYKIFIPAVVADVLQDHSLRDYDSKRTPEFLEALSKTIVTKHLSLPENSVSVVNNKICISIDDYYNSPNSELPSVEDHYSELRGDVVDQLAAYYGYDAPENGGDPVLKYAAFFGMDDLFNDPDIPKAYRDKLYSKLQRQMSSYEEYFERRVERSEDFAPMACYEQPTPEEEKAPVIERQRLFLGEADFSFSAAYLKKHQTIPTLAQQMVVTELSPLNKVIADYGQKAKDNITHLTMEGVEVKFGVDARQIHTFFKTRFRRIHFNFPHDRSSYKARTLPKIISDFFASARQLQNIGDKVLMALPKEAETKKQQFRDSYIYKVYEAAAKHGYKVVKKRPFGPSRYPGYQHVMTGQNASAKVAHEGREHVFQLIEPTSAETALNVMLFKSPTSAIETKFNYNEAHLTETNLTLPNMDTENESSEFELESNTLKKKVDEDDNDDMQDFNTQQVKRIKFSGNEEAINTDNFQDIEPQEELEYSDTQNNSLF